MKKTGINRTYLFVLWNFKIFSVETDGDNSLSLERPMPIGKLNSYGDGINFEGNLSDYYQDTWTYLLPHLTKLDNNNDIPTFNWGPLI